MTASNLFLFVALSRLPGVGISTARQLISYRGSVDRVFESSLKDLLRIPGIGEKTAREVLNKSSFSETEEILLTCEKNGIRILPFTHKEYPEKLKTIHDAPLLLYSKGDTKTLAGRTVGIVGTRKATNYGKEVTATICQNLATLDVSVISGLAYGIDIEAHRNALKSGIANHAVLASGLNEIYPKTHWKTAQEIQSTGSLISENPPDTQPDARLFPARNRIIAGLADALIVVEAAAKGGALITANIAHSYDKPVFAVPGQLTHTHSVGCNQLIRSQKALIYLNIDDLKYHLNWNEIASEKAQKVAPIPALTNDENHIFNTIKAFPNGLAIDEIAWRSQIPINQLGALLLSMEFAGAVKALPGKRFSAILN